MPDSLYDKGVITKEGEHYQLTVWYQKEISKYELSSEDFDTYTQYVEKLSAYYRQQGQSIKKSPLITRDSIPTGLDVEWMSAKQRSKMAKESRRYNKLKLDADEQGLMGFDREQYIKTGGQMEFPF